MASCAKLHAAYDVISIENDLDFLERPDPALPLRKFPRQIALQSERYVCKLAEASARTDQAQEAERRTAPAVVALSLEWRKEKP